MWGWGRAHSAEWGKRRGGKAVYAGATGLPAVTRWPPLDLEDALVEALESLEERGGEVEVVEAGAGWAGVGNGSLDLNAVVREGDLQGLKRVSDWSREDAHMWIASRAHLLVAVVRGVVGTRDGDDVVAVSVVLATAAWVAVLGEPGSGTGVGSLGWGCDGGSGEGGDGGEEGELHCGEGVERGVWVGWSSDWVMR